jgi:hypothetical protein
MKNQENLLIASLVQAMLGSISSNFRAVSIELTTDSVTLNFWLEHEDSEDREEIRDIALEFESLQSGPINLRVSTSVNQDAFTEVHLPGRIVYMRKES